MDHSGMKHDDGSDDAIEYIKFAGIILAITGLSYTSFVIYGDGSLQDFMRLFMGTFLFVFSMFKFFGYRMFVMMFPGYDLIAKRVPVYAKLFPFIEFGLAALYLVDLFPDLRHVVTIVVMGIGSIGILRQIQLKKGHIKCACLGNIIKLPLSKVSLFEDVAMTIMATFMLLS